MNNFTRIENFRAADAVAAGFSHYRENGSFVEFYDETTEFVPEDAIALELAA